MGITFKPYAALGLGKIFRQVSYEFDNDRNFIEPPPIKESMLDRYFAIHNGNFMGGILNGEEASYGGADYRETAPG